MGPRDADPTGPCGPQNPSPEHSSSVGGAEGCTARAAPGAVQDFPLRLLWAAQTPHPQHIGAPQDSPEPQLTLCFLKPSFNAVGPC